MMLAIEFLMVGVLGGVIGALVTQSAATGIAIGIIVAIAVDAIAWAVAVRATISLTHAVEVTPQQAPVLHNVIEGLCIATGLPKPKVYIVDDPSPNVFAFGRSPKKFGRRRDHRSPQSDVTPGARRRARPRDVARPQPRRAGLDARGHDGGRARRSGRDLRRAARSSRVGVTTITTAAARWCSSRSRSSPASSPSAPASCRSGSPGTARSSPTRARSRSSRPLACEKRSRSSKPITPSRITCPAPPRTSGSSSRST